MNDIDFSFETLDLNSKRCIKIVHDVLKLVVGVRSFLFDRDAFGINGQVPSDNNEAIIDGIDQIDHGKISVNIRLLIWANQLENFVKKQATIQNDFI